MQPGPVGVRRFGARGFAAVLLMLFVGCETNKRYEPYVHRAPYVGSQLWAVAPFMNESGVSIIDPARVADLYTEELQQVEGIDTVPVNRVLAAMRQLNMPSVSSGADAVALIDALGVDGLIVGTVTAYDPYNPPTLGMAVQLFKPALMQTSQIDPRSLTRQASGEVELGAMSEVDAAAQAAGLFDSRNERTRMWIDEYALGRTPMDSAFGAEVYLVRMELYTKFVSYRLIGQLLASERARMQAIAQER